MKSSCLHLTGEKTVPLLFRTLLRSRYYVLAKSRMHHGGAPETPPPSWFRFTLTWSELALTGCLHWWIIGTVILSPSDATELSRSIIHLTERFPKTFLRRAKYLYTSLTNHSNLTLSQESIWANCFYCWLLKSCKGVFEWAIIIVIQ